MEASELLPRNLTPEPHFRGRKSLLDFLLQKIVVHVLVT